MIKQKSQVTKEVHISDPRGSDFAMCGIAYESDEHRHHKFVRTKAKVNCSECIHVLTLYFELMKAYVKSDCK